MPHFAEQLGQIGRLLLQQPAHVDAGRGPGAPKGDDVGNLRQRQPEPTGAGHEGEQGERVGRVQPITGRRSRRPRQNPPRLVQTQRLAANAALCG